MSGPNMAVASGGMELSAGAITDWSSARGISCDGWRSVLMIMYNYKTFFCRNFYNVSAETYCQHFRAATTMEGESLIETYNCLKRLYQRWVQPDLYSKDEIGELIIMKQLLRVIDLDTRTWVKEYEHCHGFSGTTRMK